MQSAAEQWVKRLAEGILEAFPGRVQFIGLQGSHKRGEAGPDSDIDVVVLLDQVGGGELSRYRKLIKSMGGEEKACGFLGTRDLLARWPKWDLFHLCYDTRPIYGSLEDIKAGLSTKDAAECRKNGASSLYHAACHAYLYENAARRLPFLFKGTFYILQAAGFAETGTYMPTKRELGPLLHGEDDWVLKRCASPELLPEKEGPELDQCYARLIAWCQRNI